MALEWKRSLFFNGEYNLLDETGNYRAFATPEGNGGAYFVFTGHSGAVLPTLEEAKRYAEVMVRMEGAS